MVPGTDTFGRDLLISIRINHFRWDWNWLRVNNYEIVINNRILGTALVVTADCFKEMQCLYPIWFKNRRREKRGDKIELCKITFSFRISKNNIFENKGCRYLEKKERPGPLRKPLFFFNITLHSRKNFSSVPFIYQINKPQLESWIYSIWCACYWE